MTSLPVWPTRKNGQDEEKDLRGSLKHYDRVLAKSASLGDYVSSIQHAHTCLLLHNRLTDIHLARQRDKAERARQRGNSSRVAHHLHKIQQIEAQKLAVPAFVHPDYQKLSDMQDVTLAAEGSSALVPTAAPAAISPTRISPHSHVAHQQQQQHSSQHATEQFAGTKRDSNDNVLYLLQHQMAAISAMQQRPQQHQQQQSHDQQQPTDTQDIIRRLQMQAATTRTPSAPQLASNSPSSDSLVHPRTPRPPPPAYQPPTPPVPSSPASPPTSSPHANGRRDDRAASGEPAGTTGEYEPGTDVIEEVEGVAGQAESAYNRQGEGQTSSGPVVMLQAGPGSPAGGRSPSGTAPPAYDRKGIVWRTEGRSPLSGKEEKREEGESQRETTNGPILMLNAR